MNARQARLPLRSAPKTLADRTREHDAANLQPARDVLADAGNPKFAHVIAWARLVVPRLEGKAAR
jgi:hypothetical protein